ncbi:IDEAL domain-containing protein [Pseudogracilibacillus sp. SO30301A]|uniref:IDEAL domain-containing protein n=1 Tax=Pseudogracilibacillus sp. SO30301A TaxID=3098291 RepID=UPI00300E118A
MKKEKVNYKFFRYDGKVLLAKKEIPYEMKLTARLILDQLCYTWNKKQLQKQLNEALDNEEKEEFNKLSESYKSFIWE